MAMWVVNQGSTGITLTHDIGLAFMRVNVDESLLGQGALTRALTKSLHDATLI